MALHLTSELEQRLEHLAGQSNTDVNALASQGLEIFLADREELESMVAEGRDAVQRGDLLDHEEAMRYVDRLLDEA